MNDFFGHERRVSETATNEQLQGCIRDLMRLLALPAVWNGRNPGEILSLLCESLESALGLEACYVCARLRASEPLVCVLRIRGAFVAADSPGWQCLTAAAGVSHSGPPSMIDNTPIGALRMVSYDMGYFGEGSVCVASCDPQFPNATQALVLQAAVTLAASGLQSARLLREKEEAASAKDQFLTLLGHELRNPLAPIVTALNLMKLRAGAPLPREHQIIERQVDHLSRLVDDLLDISRLARGKVELRKEPVEMSDVVAKAVELASPLLEQRRHYLRIEAPAGLLVYGDPMRLAQVVANLLTNAAKYTEPGGNIAVRATRENDEIRLSVTDTGMGIDDQLLPRLFDLFLQGRTTIDRRGGGLGIGLSLVKALVQLHDGSVKAASPGPGHGSEFIVTLPALVRDGDGFAARAAEIRIPAAAHGERIVVVDDNRDAAEFVGEMLSAVGHDVSVAHDALQALSLIARVKPTVVVLDIGLPVMDGYELASRIREEFGDNAPRLIAVTGYGLDQDKARSKEVGIETHLVKPVNVEQLTGAVTGVGDAVM
ncbi:MAG TPA: hybrid sensor histidine kinase/response regulator [Burkholderiales bacterium]|nr:hybrid sensor histidine kinase/response regulator [Burkholderiales bacterium]